MKEKRYAVVFEIEHGELSYSTGESQFKTGSNPKIFNSKTEAKEEAKKWNTGQVVEYN